MVTHAPLFPPGGDTKRMRGPLSVAMRFPLIEPVPLVCALRHVPAATPSETLSAVSVQLTVPQGARVTLPVTAVCAPGLVCIWPSMQSTSPSNVPGPEADWGPA